MTLPPSPLAPRSLSFDQAVKVTAKTQQMSPVTLRAARQQFVHEGTLVPEHAPRIERDNPLHKQFGEFGEGGAPLKIQTLIHECRSMRRLAPPGRLHGDQRRGGRREAW